MRFWVIATLFIFPSISHAQENSILSSGNWLKFSTTKNEGIYKITYAQLQSVGWSPKDIDPKKIQLYTGSEGMLPQPNNSERISDMQEMAIWVSGESDGVFHSSDYILFYGKGPDHFEYGSEDKSFLYEKNLYSDINFYFLTLGTQNGKRITSVNSMPEVSPAVDKFIDFVHYEKDKYNRLTSGREWFGERFSNAKPITFSATIPGIVANTNMTFISQVMAYSLEDCSFNTQLNGVEILKQPVGKILNETYSIKGIIQTDTVIVNTSTVKFNEATQNITYQFTPSGEGISVGHLDFFTITFWRHLTFHKDNGLMFFTSPQSVQNNVSTFQLASDTDPIWIWNVTDQFLVMRQEVNTSGTHISFSAKNSPLQRFCAFVPDQAIEATYVSTVKNQNLHGLDKPELLIITHSSLLDQANRLAHHRREYSRLKTTVVTVDQIYHEYSGGKQDVTALRDFIRFLYLKPGPTLKHVLLFGRGSYAYKDQLPYNVNLVPIYQSRESLDPLYTYCSDDYYGFMDDDHGEWREKPAQNDSVRIGLGRLPVRTPQEASAIVDKLIDYDTQKNVFKEWLGKILFIADDGEISSSIHMNQSDRLSLLIDTDHPEYISKRVYVDNFEQIRTPARHSCPDMYEEVLRLINHGFLIVNFTGHGSEKQWMHENVFDLNGLESLHNNHKYPLFITATCDFGRNDDPALISMGEQLITLKNSGSIGLISSTRPVYSDSNFDLNNAFYTAIFKNPDELEMGTLFKKTKNSSFDRKPGRVGNRNYMYLGDPSLRLSLPENKIVVTSALTSTGLATFSELSEVIIKGEIRENGSKISTLNGEVKTILYDRPWNQRTKGDENPPYVYTEWTNIVFQGKASVHQGSFEFRFTLPTGFASQATSGPIPDSLRFHFYMQDENHFYTGSYLHKPVDGRNPNPNLDTTPPQIKMYMYDPSFESGGITGERPELIAELSDEHGIYLLKQNTEKSLHLVVNNEKVYEVGEYYSSEKDNPKKGTLRFSLDYFEPGDHQIVLHASDIYGNTATDTIWFSVYSDVHIKHFYGYPNPFRNKTTLTFLNNQVGSTLYIDLWIYSSTGQLMKKETLTIPNSPYKVIVGEWDGTQNGKPMNSSLYLARIIVRSSKSKQSKNLVCRLIIN